MLAIRHKPFLSLTAADLMSPGVVTIPQDMSLRAAADLLTREHINGAPVIDREDRCIGNLSAADYLSFWTRDPMTDDHTVRAYMSTDPVTVVPSIPITDLTRKMIDAHIHRVIVVDEQDRPIGVVSSTDVLAAVTYGQHEPL